MTSGSRTLRLGTRGSALALAQSRQVAAAITATTGIPVELVPITSAGDVTRASLAEIGGTGVFATALRDALIAGECDLLVHSLKDLPTAAVPGLEIAAVPERADARDVVVTRHGTVLEGLSGRVGTGSPRRVAQLHRAYPGLDVVDLRGNVDSRIARVRSGELDAVVLAAAGLDRLEGAGLGSFGDSPRSLDRHALDLATWPTAPGQGALAVEIRADDDATREAVASLEHPATRVAVEAERAVLATLEAGCHAPVSVNAALKGDALRIRALVYALDGAQAIDADLTIDFSGPDAGRAELRSDTDEYDRGYAEDPGSGNGADAAGDADPIARARRAGFLIARRLLVLGAADLVE